MPQQSALSLANRNKHIEQQDILQQTLFPKRGQIFNIFQLPIKHYYNVSLSNYFSLAYYKWQQCSFFLVFLNFKERNREWGIIVIESSGPFHENVNKKNSRNEIVFDRLWYPLAILLLAAIGAKLIGPHGGLQVDKNDMTLRNWLHGMADCIAQNQRNSKFGCAVHVDINPR